MNRAPFIRLIGSLVILVFVLAGYGFWYSLLSAKSGAVSTLAAQIAEQNDATSQVAEAKAELTQLSTQAASVDQYFVATNNVVPFLEEIQSIGKYLGANVQIVSVSATPPASGVPYGTLTLSLSIAGSFDAVERTLGSIEYGPFDTTLTSLTFNTTPSSATSATSSAPVWTADAQFIVGAQTGNTQTASQTSEPLSQTTGAILQAAAKDTSIPPTSAQPSVTSPTTTSATSTPATSAPVVASTSAPTTAEATTTTDSTPVSSSTPLKAQ